MYSDRVDSVTRATNPSLLPSLPSTPRAHLVRRPPPPPVLGISQCIDVYKPPRLAVEFSLRRSFLSFSLFLVTYILSLPSMPIPRSLSPFPPYSPIASRPIFLLLIPLRRIPICSRCLFHYFVISPYLPFPRVSHLLSLRSLCRSISRSMLRPLSLKE